MAALLVLASSQIPTLPEQQYANPTLNMRLENAMNPALTGARDFYSNCRDCRAAAAGDLQ
jgi:hypothetical protein